MGSLFKRLWVAAESALDALLFLAARAGLIALYQPIFGKGTSGDRACQDRWRAIEPLLPKGHFSFLDVGSQIGYFTLSAANRGATAIGLERVFAYARLADAIRRRNRIQGAAFLNLEVNSRTVPSLPKFDVLCCMSVYHHWVIDWGREKADEILGELCRHTENIIFETGQADEQNQAWTSRLNYMKPDPKAWCENFLRSQGFQRLHYLGTFPTHLSPVPRHLFFASKTG